MRSVWRKRGGLVVVVTMSVREPRHYAHFWRFWERRAWTPRHQRFLGARRRRVSWSALDCDMFSECSKGRAERTFYDRLVRRARLRHGRVGTSNASIIIYSIKTEYSYSGSDQVLCNNTSVMLSAAPFILQLRSLSSYFVLSLRKTTPGRALTHSVSCTCCNERSSPCPRGVRDSHHRQC